MKKRFILIIMSIITLGILILGASYFINKALDNSQKSLKKDGIRPMFYTDAGKVNDFTIGTLPDISVNSPLATKEVSVNLSLQNNYDSASACSYDIFFEWQDNPYAYYKTEGSENELTISGIVDNVKLFDDVVIKDFNLSDKRTKLSSYSVSNEGNGLTSQMLDLTLKLNKVAQNQEKHENASYPFLISIDNVRCSGASKLLEKDLSKDNYVCLSHENDPYCPEESLYQVISVTGEGIKIVRPLEYGTAVWSDNLIQESFQNYINNYLREYQNVIIDYNWPLSNYEDNNLSYEEAIKAEKTVSNKVSSKVGLLSYSDILKNDYLKELDMPILLLATNGRVYTKDGMQSKNGGVIYPTLYLKEDVLVSKGNGTYVAPYYVN